MSVHLTRSNAINFHVPRTGGTWVHKAMINAGIELTTFHPQGFPHSTYQDEPIEGKFIFAFIRHPFAWYESYYHYRVSSGWEQNWWLDNHCNRDTFEQFLQSVIKLQVPYLTNLYNEHLGKPIVMSFIGTQEHVVDDLVHVLKLIKEDFDEEKLRNTPRQHVGQIKKQSVSQELKDKLLSLETEALKLWEKYYE